MRVSKSTKSADDGPAIESPKRLGCKHVDRPRLDLTTIGGAAWSNRFWCNQP
jgi:hypothetical protein